MTMVKVKSYIRNGKKVSSYTRNSKSSSDKNNTCSPKDVAKKFKELEYMTKISPTISTGNKFIDKTVAKAVANAAGHLVKNPKGKLMVKGVQKAYPHIEKAGANIARAKAAYDETCKKRK